MRKVLLALPIAAVALGLVGAAPAQADGNHGANGHKAGSHKAVKLKPVKAKAPSTFLVAKLSGANEVPTPGGPAVADPEGQGVALVRVKGNRVSFSLNVQGIDAATAAHIHEGKAGVNGPVKVELFATPLPATVNAAAGAVHVDDAALAKKISQRPHEFYFNVHTAAFPGGAVRAQLQKLKKPTDVLSIIKGGGIRSLLDADQEVQKPGGSPVGDPNGHAVGFLRPKGTNVGFSLAWVGIDPPTVGHLHQGKRGTNGDVKVELFTTPLPSSIFAISGVATNQDATLVQQVRKTPGDFYLNLHNAAFKDGALRGQLLH